MKVIGSGFMKTGRKSLHQALTILGYKTYHIDEQMFYLGDQLLKALNEGCTTEEFREMFKDVDAVTDLPSAKLWEEIHKAFPEAKIAPKHQTLFFQPRDGWGPLCEFLGVPVPDEPFPHLNKKGSIVTESINDSKMFNQLRKELFGTVPLLMAICAFLVYYIIQLCF